MPFGLGEDGNVFPEDESSLYLLMGFLFSQCFSAPSLHESPAWDPYDPGAPMIGNKQSKQVSGDKQIELPVKATVLFMGTLFPDRKAFSSYDFLIVSPSLS